MSRTGKIPVQFENNVTVTNDKGNIVVKGPKGELSYDFSDKIDIEVKDSTVTVIRRDDGNKQKSMHGTARSLINNMIIGVTEGFSKSLEVVGVGFRVGKKGSDLELTVGFSHPVFFNIPEGIECELEKNTIHIRGIDKQLVGEVAANIRAIKKPEPYKGKGIKYTNEQIRRKAGKAGKAAV